MRVFAILLLLANIGFFAAWQQGWVTPTRASAPLQVRAAFQPAQVELRLLRELPGNQLDLMADIAEAEERRTGVEAQLAETEAAREEIRERLAQVEPDIPPAEQPSATPVPWCAEAGLFASREEAVAFVDDVLALGGRSEIVGRPVPVSSTWWVHLPAFPSEQAARPTLNELQAKNIDSYYVRSGELTGVISLGVFSRRESAENARIQLEASGYQPDLYEMFRYEERLYVALELPDGSLLESPEWARLGAPQAVEKACETIAPPFQFP